MIADMAEAVARQNTRDAELRDLWENHPEVSVRRIGELFGINPKTLGYHARKRGWGPRRTYAYVAEYEHTMRDDWNACVMSAAEIGAKYGVTKNAVIGLARRRGWAERRSSTAPRTLEDRLQPLWDQMDIAIAYSREVARSDRALRRVSTV